MQIKRSIIGLMVGLFLGIIISYFLQSVNFSFVDKKEDMNYAGLVVLGEKLNKYKKHCGTYPGQDIGLEALTVSSSNKCFPENERIETVPLDYADQKILYFEKNGDFFLVSQMNKKAFITSMAPSMK